MENLNEQRSNEAMKLALDNLIAEYYMENSSFAKRIDDIFKEALAEQPAQPQQEPLSIEILRYHLDAEGYMVQDRDGEWIEFDSIQQPAQRKPLTDEQIAAIGKELGLKCRLGGNPNIDFDYARAIEAAHGIKENT